MDDSGPRSTTAGIQLTCRQQDDATADRVQRLEQRRGVIGHAVPLGTELGLQVGGLGHPGDALLALLVTCNEQQGTARGERP